jgi:hypothetical protein
VVGNMKYVVYCRSRQILFEVLLEYFTIQCPAVDSERTLKDQLMLGLCDVLSLPEASYMCVFYLTQAIRIIKETSAALIKTWTTFYLPSFT